MNPKGPANTIECEEPNRPRAMVVAGAMTREVGPPMHEQTYQQYLQSPQWDEQRRAALQRAGHRCQSCDDDDTTLEVHHLTYERLGKEEPSDLETLCWRCHAAEHGKLNERMARREATLNEAELRAAAELASNDTSVFTTKLDALLQNSPEFWCAWVHHGHPDWRLSQWDMSLCSHAAGCMNDAELRLLVYCHRKRWGQTSDQANEACVLMKLDYVRARQIRDDASRGLSELARRA